jgi:hypothetical protein
MNVKAVSGSCALTGIVQTLGSQGAERLDDPGQRAGSGNGLHVHGVVAHLPGHHARLAAVEQDLAVRALACRDALRFERGIRVLGLDSLVEEANPGVPVGHEADAVGHEQVAEVGRRRGGEVRVVQALGVQVRQPLVDRDRFLGRVGDRAAVSVHDIAVHEADGAHEGLDVVGAGGTEAERTAAVADRVAIAEGDHHVIDLFQRARRLEAQLVQPVLADGQHARALELLEDGVDAAVVVGHHVPLFGRDHGRVAEDGGFLDLAGKLRKDLVIDEDVHRVLVRVDEVVLHTGREVGKHLLAVVRRRVNQLHLDAGQAGDLLSEELVLFRRLAADDGAQDTERLALERELRQELLLRGREFRIHLGGR